MESRDTYLGYLIILYAKIWMPPLLTVFIITGGVGRLRKDLII